MRSRSHTAWLKGFLCVASVLFPLFAHAGQNCQESELSLAQLHKAMSTAQRVTQELEARKEDVALLGRMGQDLSSYGLKYSHMGFLFRSSPEGPWRIVHLLNACGTDKSDLWYQGVGNFFLDDLHSYDAVLVIPAKPVGDRLLRRFQDANALHSVHSERYSLVGYPFSTRYQNSNDWVLETLASVSATDAQINNREQAQAWLKITGYRPSELRIDPLKRLGGRLLKANVAFDDHPSALRFSGRIQTVTVESIIQFLSTRGDDWQVVDMPFKDT